MLVMVEVSLFSHGKLAYKSKNPLKQVKLPFKTSKFCDDHAQKEKALASQKLKDIGYLNSTTQVCAGDITGQNDVCSGGPAMVSSINPTSGQWRWFQVGNLSREVACAQYRARLTIITRYLLTLIRSKT